MKKAIIKNIKLPYPEFNWDMVDEENKLLQRIEENRHLYGKPERWVLVDSESYDPSDILQTEERTFEYVDYELNDLGHTIEIKKQRKETWVKLKADYTIEIIDLEKDYDWLLSECHRKRKEEYPPITELGDALYWKENGNDSKYKEYIKKCDEVKKKYPLPIRSNT